MEDEIRKFVDDHDCAYEPITSPESIEKIHSLLILGNMYEPVTGLEYDYLGWYYELDGDAERAKSMYLKAVELGDVMAMEGLGRIFTEDGNLAEAEVWFTKGSRLANPWCQYNLAWLYQKQSNFVEAERWYLEALRGGHPTVIFSLERMYLRLGEPRKALELYGGDPQTHKSRIKQILRANPRVAFDVFNEKVGLVRTVAELEEKVKKYKLKALHYKFSPTGYMDAKQRFEQSQQN